jgi:hypothetical protein
MQFDIDFSSIYYFFWSVLVLCALATLLSTLEEIHGRLSNVLHRDLEQIQGLTSNVLHAIRTQKVVEPSPV